MLSIFADWFIKVYKSIYFPQDVFSDLKEINNISDSISEAALYQGLNTIILTIAISILTIYFILDLYEKSSMNNFLTMEQLVLAFLKFTLAAILMFYSRQLVTGIINFSGALVNTLEGIDTSPEKVCWFDQKTKFNNLDKNSKNRIQENITVFKVCLNKLSLVNGFVFLIKVIPPYFCALIADVIFYIIMISRSAELIVRTLFCPIAIANTFTEVSRSNAVRYLKKMLALSLQFALAVAIILSFNAIIKETTSAIPDPSETFNVTITETPSMGLLQDNKDHMIVTMNPTDPDKTGYFLATLLGGSDYWMFLGLSVAKIAMLFKTQMIAKDIAGAT